MRGLLLAGVLCALGAPARAAASTGRDFVSEARTLMRMTSCHGDAELPGALPAKVARNHCKRLARAVASYEKSWAGKARPFFAKLVPKTIPKTVVYPFGGGDLLTALVVFPALSEITTISLEPAGDVRAASRLSRGQLIGALAGLRAEMEWLLIKNYGRTKRMRVVMTQGRLPGQLVFSLLALAIHGYEPVSVRYFSLDANGGMTYLDDQGIALARRRAFANVEIRFRKGNGPVRVFRHIQQNLDDAGWKSPGGQGLAKHLEAKGKITAMTKAASYLLWWRRFSQLRRYLLGHMAWMVSDSTGLLPRHTWRAGFEHRVWGSFNGCFINIAKYLSDEQARMWRSKPYRRMPFRFGYPDNKGSNHLMVTRPKKR